MANEESGRPSPYLIKLVLLGLGLIVVAFLLWQMLSGDEPVEEPTPMVQPEPERIPDPQPEPQPEPEPEPIEPEPEPEPLPDLAQSDEVVLAAAEQVSSDGNLRELLVEDNVLQKSVRAVIAAADGNVVYEYRPIQSPGTPFAVEQLDEPPTDAGQRYRLSAENYARYEGYVNALTSLQPSTVASVFQRFYPLLEQAYEQHGVNEGSFKKLTLDAIDSLLAAPVLEEEPILVQPGVYYQFEDPRLEALPATQKLLIRMGPENTRKVQAALRELRSAIESVQE